MQPAEGSDFLMTPELPVELMSIGPAGDEQVNSTNRQTELRTVGNLSRFHKVSCKVFSCFWMSALLWRKSNYCVTTSLKILQIWTFRWFYFMTATEKQVQKRKAEAKNENKTNSKWEEHQSDSFTQFIQKEEEWRGKNPVRCIRRYVYVSFCLK